MPAANRARDDGSRWMKSWISEWAVAGIDGSYATGVACVSVPGLPLVSHFGTVEALKGQPKYEIRIKEYEARDTESK